MDNSKRIDGKGDAIEGRSLEGVPLDGLLKGLAGEVVELGQKQVELAKAELKADVKAEIAAAKGLSASAVIAILFANMLLVAAALALGTVMSGWLAALIVAGVLFAVGAAVGLFAWNKRVKKPLQKTRAALSDDVKLVKEQTT